MKYCFTIILFITCSRYVVSNGESIKKHPAWYHRVMYRVCVQNGLLKVLEEYNKNISRTKWTLLQMNKQMDKMGVIWYLISAYIDVIYCCIHIFVLCLCIKWQISTLNISNINSELSARWLSETTLAISAQQVIFLLQSCCNTIEYIITTTFVVSDYKSFILPWSYLRFSMMEWPQDGFSRIEVFQE